MHGTMVVMVDVKDALGEEILSSFVKYDFEVLFQNLITATNECVDYTNYLLPPLYDV